MSFLTQVNPEYTANDPSNNSIGGCFHQTSYLDGITRFTNFNNDASGNVITSGGYKFYNFNSSISSPLELATLDLAGNFYVADVSGNASGLNPAYNLIEDASGNSVRTTAIQQVLNNHPSATTTTITSNSVGLANGLNTSSLTASQLAMSSGNPSLPATIVMTDTTSGYTNNLQYNQITMNGLDSVFTAQSNAMFLQNGNNDRQIVMDLAGNQIYCADENGFGSKISTHQNIMYDSSNNTITTTPLSIVMADVNSNVLSSLTASALKIGNVILKSHAQPTSPVDGEINWNGTNLTIYSSALSAWKTIVLV